MAPTDANTAIAGALENWSLFNNDAYLNLSSVDVAANMGSFSVSFTVGASAAQIYTYGNISASIANFLNTNLGVFATPTDSYAAGTGSTSTLAQFFELGGPTGTISPIEQASDAVGLLQNVLVTAASNIPQSANPQFPWLWVGLGAATLAGVWYYYHA